MPLKNELGENISTAVNILRKTYENLNLLFSEMDVIAEKEGFVSLTPKFLRWKSDSATNGWLTSNFIKLYQIENQTSILNLPEVREGYVYCVEVDLESDKGYPVISLAKLSYDFSQWTRVPSVSDHWIFNDIFHNYNNFIIDEKDSVWTSKPNKKSVKKYWGLQSAIGMGYPLVHVSSSESIRTEIFDRLLTI
ncbi:hypothetical protein CVD25_22835 [Bacillus canaveralius]|uniref:Uncharacterized protein n=1 Tax=Bacillus canaveralius TaxID=1403243 RepID=A0A2N5GGA3_9BACI|nr:hypothetical protein [Bacillus canaveralius]PLR79794.1 hypothetical protein CU635_21185 [Bacillus canaveralius]PLR88293.1 hypothetical protein CVD25_22835 [Bacillus canaveralius]